MVNALASAMSPYLRAHADNPVDWLPWGEDAFAEAVRRDVPVLVSIGYATCHWCHVMARESFSDAGVAEYLNTHFVAVKVDREEHPDVDAAMIAAASVFTQNLGWPLNVFTTPEGKPIFAGTYFPPEARQGSPSFRQVLEGIAEAWRSQRDEVERTGAAILEAFASAPRPHSELPSLEQLDGAVTAILDTEDADFGGFGRAPKFPMVPVVQFVLEHGDNPVSGGVPAASRTLMSMARSDLRDADGGFFRYATNRDWTVPHYERMLYDNAQLLRAYAVLAVRDSGVRDEATEVASGIVKFLLGTLRLPGGAFASAQDSESMIDGERSEGGYFQRPPAERDVLEPPALDEKVLTGWNGLAIGALAHAGFRLDRPEWVDAARVVADRVLELHYRGGALVRASAGGVVSDAPATLEDYGMLAAGLLDLALASGDARYASVARDLVYACREGDGFAVAADSVLERQGLTATLDPSEGAHPSGLSAVAEAARMLHALTGDHDFERAATTAMESVAVFALRQPMAFGSALTVMGALAAPLTQVVVVTGRPTAAGLTALAGAARAHFAQGAVAAIVTECQARVFAEAGFALFEGKAARDDEPTGYACEAFTCRLPTTDSVEFTRALAP